MTMEIVTMRPHYERIALLASFASSFVGVVSMPAQSETVYQGNVCSSRVSSLTGQIDWYTNLKEAQQKAREENKLVFWMHMLGKIYGAT